MPAVSTVDLNALAGQWLRQIEAHLPTAWYNLAADLPSPLPPPLHPGTLQPLGPDDHDWLTGVLRRHHEETGSPVAEALLAEGLAGLGRFSKIMPTDYRRILDIQDKALADGRDPIEAVMEEMSRG